MGYPTKVQLIQRQNSEQWYINFPAALAQAMEFTRGEVVEWIIEDHGQLRLRRLKPPAGPKKKRRDSSTTSSSWESCPSASRRQRVAERAQTLALSGLLCLGRRTVTGLLSTCGLRAGRGRTAGRQPTSLECYCTS